MKQPEGASSVKLKAFHKWSETQKFMALQVAAGVLIAAFSGTSGYFIGTTSKSAKSLKGLMGACSSRSLASVRDQEEYDAWDESGGRNPASVGPDAVYYAIVEKDHLEEKNGKLAALFPHTEIGKALAHLTTLSDFVPGEDSPEGVLLAEEVKLLESQPHRAYEHIRKTIRKMGNDLSGERQLLIQLIGKLDLELSRKTDFLTEELNREEKVAALSTMMQLEVDPTTIESALRQSISGNLTYSSRLLLLNIFETRYPEQARRIKYDHGI